MAKEKTVSILGCGWLGLPLAERLLNAGYQVKGSTTTYAKLDLLRQKGIEPFLIDLNGEAASSELAPFLKADNVVISFPPGLRAGNGEKYRGQIALLRQALAAAAVNNILFISSTSVYPDLNKTVTEAEDLRAYLPGNILLTAEALMAEIPGKVTTILRMSGLVGGNRHPGRFFAGKLNVPHPESPVNLIHLEDCNGIISAILEMEKWGEIYNACSDKHPTRQSFYTAAARQLNLPEPQFAPATPNDKFKIISNQKVKDALSYRFVHPDPMLFF